MKIVVKIFRYLFKAVLFLAFRFNPVGCSRFLGVKIGKNLHIYGGSPSMWGTEPFLITLGDNVHVTHGCVFVTHDGGSLILRNEVPDLELTAPIKVGSDVYLGVRTIILPGVTIGTRVIVGAGSVVTKNIPDNSVAVGVPARVIKTVDEYLEGAKKRSLHLGHLQANEKEKALRQHFADWGNKIGS